MNSRCCSSPKSICRQKTSSRCRVFSVHRSFVFPSLPFTSSAFAGKQKTLLTFRKQGERNPFILQNLLTPRLSILPSGPCPNGPLDSARANAFAFAQPGLYRLCRVAFALRIVGQLVADMFMQVLIERGETNTTKRRLLATYTLRGRSILNSNIRMDR